MLRNYAHRLVLSLSLLAASALSAQTPEVRFFPNDGVYAHEVEIRRGIQGALLQNGAIVNRGSAEITLESAALEVMRDGQVVASSAFASAELEKAAKKGAGLVASGMFAAFSFQFRPDLLLGAGAKLGTSTHLAPGEALLLGHKYITWSGPADHLRLRFAGHDAAGAVVEASGEIAIENEPSKITYHFPLAGRWFIAAGSTPHSHHRWVAAEEFAFDIVRIGEGMRTSRGDGTKRQDYYAYGAEVLAAAAGTVVRVVDSLEETDGFLRQPGEAFAAYNERVAAMQDGLMQKGLDTIAGNVVVIDHGNGEFSHYAHLKTGSAKVKVGEQVKQGQPLALLGTSGNSTEPHLHFQITSGPDPLNSVGRPCRFANIELPFADWERQLQTGDIVDVK